MRSDHLEGHMKANDKYKSKIILQTNEEICKELVMGLVNTVHEKTSEQKDRNEDLIEERLGSKRTYDDISQNSTELCSINVEALENLKIVENIVKKLS